MRNPSISPPSRHPHRRPRLAATPRHTLPWLLLSGVLVAAGFTVADGARPEALTAQTPFTRADSLRGSEGPGRSWWDVTYYDLDVRISPADSSISGSNTIVYDVLSTMADPRLQIDLQPPLSIDSMIADGSRVGWTSEGNAHFIEMSGRVRAGERRSITVHYGGRPVIAVRPPWDGGFIWAADGGGQPWVATANQGLGASVWWPNKDFQAEEPDSQRITLTVPAPLSAVSNGRLRERRTNADGTRSFEWFVSSPINNYGIAVNAARFAHWQETYPGLDGPLTLDFWPLAENEAAARAQWAQTSPMLRCFEEWFGPYPWYDDGFKMIESPHLGMEHQSAIAYGNGYQNGYLGRDLSGTGRGLDWDFIIVHEAAHEWWGNNITTRDVADMWVHESFAAYAENLYVECLNGSGRAGAEYVIGTRAQILNDVPVVGQYGVQNQGSGDMYYKGANMLHTIRQLVDDDALWKSTLRRLNEVFARRTITGADVESRMEAETGVPLGPVFDQYLRSVQIPVLEWFIEEARLTYRWSEAVDGFAMPVRVHLDATTSMLLHPRAEWRTVAVPAGSAGVEIDADWYVIGREAPPR